MKQAGEAAAQLVFGRPHRGRRMTGSAKKAGPRPAAPAIDVFQLEAGGGKETGEGPSLGRKGFHLVDEAPEAGADGLAEVIENDARRHAVELDGAAGRQVGEALLDLSLETGP